VGHRVGNGVGERSSIPPENMVSWFVVGYGVITGDGIVGLGETGLGTGIKVAEGAGLLPNRSDEPAPPLLLLEAVPLADFTSVGLAALLAALPDEFSPNPMDRTIPSTTTEPSTIWRMRIPPHLVGVSCVAGVSWTGR
jgi:hypothetical protein